MRIKIWSALSTGGGEGFRLAVVVADVDQAQNYVSNTLPRSGSRMVDYRIIPASTFGDETSVSLETETRVASGPPATTTASSSL